MPKSSTATSGQVGNEILSYCTSCKMDLNHIVAAMKGDRVAKVQCLTCKKDHLYRAPKGITEPPKAKKPRKTKDSAEMDTTHIEAEWNKLMAVNKAAAKKYTMKTSFLLGEKIAHTKFGEGVISKLIYPNKLEVMFRTDIKILIHGGQAYIGKRF